MKDAPLLSICIPSYNRPRELERLLDSVDSRPEQVEIVIREDCSPARTSITETVRRYQAGSPYRVVFRENERNLGYDANFRRLIESASGEFVLLMGDDDLFLPNALNPYLDFLSQYRDVAYVLRSYCSEHQDGTREFFRYCPSTRAFEPGEDTCAFMFKRSVSLAGFTIRRTEALRAATDRFDGTLLYQLHLVLETVFTQRSVFCDLPVAMATQTFRNDRPQFGTARAEARFQPGKVTQTNSIIFTLGFFEIARAFDRAHGTRVADRIALDLSKYSYPILSIQRKNGVIPFLRYSLRLSRETPINRSWHYWFYAGVLAVLGESICDKSIVWLKRRLGYTPSL